MNASWPFRVPGSAGLSYKKQGTAAFVAALHLLNLSGGIAIITSMMKTLIIFSLYLSLVSSLAFNAPVATSVWKGFQLEPQGWSPKPTDAPSMEELRKRQNIEGLITGPDGTCGFISGSSGDFLKLSIRHSSG